MINKILCLCGVDLKIILRTNLLIAIIPLLMIIFILMFYFAKINSLIYPVLFILLSYENIYNNMFNRTKHEFLSYNLIPIAYPQLLIAKDVSCFVVTFLTVMFTNTILLTLFKLNMNKLIDSTIYFLSTFILMLIFSNLISIRRERGNFSIRNLFIHFAVVSFSSSPYLIINHYRRVPLLFPSFILLVGGYYLALKGTANLLKKRRYELLEERNECYRN